MDTLRRAAAALAAKNWAAASVVILLWSYLHRAARRFDSLATRGRAGRLKSRPAPNPAPASAPIRPRTSRPPATRLPRQFGWLVWLVPEARHARSQLEYLLADPEVAAMLAAAPQAARILRPLCWMLGIEPSPDRPAILFRPVLLQPRPARRATLRSRPRACPEPAAPAARLANRTNLPKPA